MLLKYSRGTLPYNPFAHSVNRSCLWPFSELLSQTKFLPKASYCCFLLSWVWVHYWAPSFSRSGENCYLFGNCGALVIILGELGSKLIFWGVMGPCQKVKLNLNNLTLKGTAALMISMFYQKELYEPWILKQVSSKLVKKWGSFGHLKNSIWLTFSRHFEYSISFQNFFNCLIFSYQYYHINCVSADMQLYMCDVTKPTIWRLHYSPFANIQTPITSALFNRFRWNWYQNSWFIKIFHIKHNNNQGCRPL